MDSTNSLIQIALVVGGMITTINELRFPSTEFILGAGTLPTYIQG